MTAPRKRLLAAGIAGIVAVAAAPHARDAWLRHRLGEDEAQRRLYVALKEREIDCLERLLAGGLPEGDDVEAEIGKCRALSIDPASGEPVEGPS